MAKRRSKFYISQSGLSAFFSCPARYDFKRKLQPKKVDRALQDGIDAHAILAGQEVPKASSRARWFAEKIDRLRQKYTILPGGETLQEIEWKNGIVLVRKIDAPATSVAGPIILDYKTATWEWWSPDGILFPQAHSFQSILYLIPPDDPAPFRKWPRELHYLVVAERGGEDDIPYYYDHADLRNLEDATEQVRGATTFPKHQGYQCKNCPFFDACYQTPGWENKFTKKGKKE